MKIRSVQYLTSEYLEYCRTLTPDQIADFLEDFRQLHGPQTMAEVEELWPLPKWDQPLPETPVARASRP
jgi:hypothetical protein